MNKIAGMLAGAGGLTSTSTSAIMRLEKTGARSGGLTEMALVATPECGTCHRKQGQRHRATMKQPTMAKLEQWDDKGIARATDGCRVEPDGECPHGHQSWLERLGYI